MTDILDIIHRLSLIKNTFQRLESVSGPEIGLALLTRRNRVGVT
jgi:hypothetical protein